MLEKIRTYLAQNHLDAILIPHQDEYLGEYLTPDKERLKAVSGFTGSAGLAIITQDKAVLFTDSRYTEQAKRQTTFDVFEVPTQTTPVAWLNENCAKKKVAFDANVHSTLFVKHIQDSTHSAKITLIPLDSSPVDMFWTNRPTPLPQKVMDYDLKYAGETTRDKLLRVAHELKKQKVQALLLADPESVSWLLNKRDLQNPECPIYFERGVVYQNGTYETLSDDTYEKLKGKKVALDVAVTPFALYQKLADSQIVELPDIVAQMKAVKNDVEISHLKQACLFESQTICRFLAFVEEQKETITELDCVAELHHLRAKNPLYVADSFEVIAASGAHAAQAHYAPTNSTSCFVRKNALLLVDTGGQYLNGTTDMTRTICVVKPTPLTTKRYTQVLKGHIALATAQIREGELPAEIDTPVHAPLREDGVDYLHATGHGIGMFLSVHETPPTIHEKSKTPLYAGMVFSNEPACYDSKNGFGIRLENMLLSVKNGDNMLSFENLLFIPFDSRLVDFSMLTDMEKEWLKNYHKRIITDVFPGLDGRTKALLQPLINPFL